MGKKGEEEASGLILSTKYSMSILSTYWFQQSYYQKKKKNWKYEYWVKTLKIIQF